MHPVKYLPLDVRDDLPGILLVPVPVQLLGDGAELDQELTRQIVRFEFAALLPPKPKQRGFVITHDNSGIGPADKRAAVT